MAVSFTEEQKEAIFDDGHNLLVSASAGSGKTTVMIERIIQLLKKYKDTDNPLSISDFLVVTFTKASASDMKQKLIKSLSELNQDEFIVSQIEKVATSDISNLHSFCSRLVGTYFYAIGIDPAVKIIDDTQSEFLKNKALDKLIEIKEKNGDEDYFKLFDMFQTKRSDKALREIIKRFDENLKENIDGEKWFKECLNNSFNTNLNENVSANIINSYAVGLMQDYTQDIDELMDISHKLGLEKIADFLLGVEAEIKTINKHNSFELNSKNLFDIKIKAIPKVDSEFGYFHDRVTGVIAELKKSIENLKANFVSNDIEYHRISLEKTKETLISLFNISREFASFYDNLKKEMNGVDFHDLEHLALKILSDNSICEAVKNKYRYVLVDEYQDINEIQEKIISLVSKNNNRFMVGDVKQSIYRFRFCDPSIFLQKFNLYEKNTGDNRLIKLNCNFRSDKKILKFVDKVFSGVMTDKFGEYDYAKNSVFVAGENNLDLPSAANLCFIECKKSENEKKEYCGVYSVKNHTQSEKLETSKAKAEACLVAQKIKEIMATQKKVTFDDFAVLVASRNENIDIFVESLKAFNIPVSADKKYNLMEMPYVQEIINYIRLSANKNDDFVLFKVLKSRMFCFSDQELADIRKTNKSDRFFEVFYNYANLSSGGTDSLRQKVQNFNQLLEKYSKLAKIMTVKDFAKKVINDFDLKLINLAGENGTQKSKDIDDFVSALPNVDVFDYVAYYLDSSLIKESESENNAVKVMTIHKSKGIEFRYVFMINLANEFNLKSTYQKMLFNKNLGIGIDYFDIENRTQQSTIPIAAIRMVEKRKLVEEQQRLLYVAMTRAVERLYVVCTGESGKLLPKVKKHPTAFINWFEPIILNCLDGHIDEFLTFEKYDISELLNIPQKEKNQFLLTDTNKIEEVKWFEYKNNAAKNIPLKNSVSKILAISNDDEIYEQTRFESDAVSNADRGTLYHGIFQKLDLKNRNTLDSQVDNILNSLDENQRILVDKDKIMSVLNLEFFAQIENDDVILQEREFYAKMPASMIDKETTGEFILQGIVDLAVIHGDEIWILDYKTGKYSDDKRKKYEFQVKVYANALERAFEKKVTRKVICFIDEQKNIEF